jgi:hypothetical protein
MLEEKNPLSKLKSGGDRYPDLTVSQHRVEGPDLLLYAVLLILHFRNVYTVF